jgi:hypothetical protein
MIDAGFRPGSRACCLARPEERHHRLVRLEERILCVEQKNPIPVALFETHQATVPPRPVSSEWTDAKHRRAGQLTVLKQGPPSDVSVRPGGRAAGVGQWEG